jgi:hypothetical protein
MRGCNAVALLCTCAILLSAWGAQAQVAWNQAGQFNYQLSECQAHMAMPFQQQILPPCANAIRRGHKQAKSSSSPTTSYRV